MNAQAWKSAVIKSFILAKDSVDPATTVAFMAINQNTLLYNVCYKKGCADYVQFWRGTLYQFATAFRMQTVRVSAWYENDWRVLNTTQSLLSKEGQHKLIISQSNQPVLFSYKTVMFF